MLAASNPFSRHQLLLIARSLPADLQVLASLGEVLQDINTDLDDVATLIRQDVALGARVVRISNSPVFAAGGIGSIEEALHRIGFAEVHRLVGMATTARLAERALPFYGIDPETLHDVMLYGALASEALARAAGFDPRPAYTAGLLRPLGLMVLDCAARQHLTIEATYSPGGDNGYAAWEGRVFGVSNCDITGLILDEWHFPPELGAAVREHYLVRTADYANAFACRLNLAGWIAREGGSALPGESVYWDITPKKIAAAGLTEEQVHTAAADTAVVFAETRMALA